MLVLIRACEWRCPRRQDEGFHPLMLELPEHVMHILRVLGTKLGSSACTVCNFKLQSSFQSNQTMLFKISSRSNTIVNHACTFTYFVWRALRRLQIIGHSHCLISFQSANNLAPYAPGTVSYKISVKLVCISLSYPGKRWDCTCVPLGQAHIGFYYLFMLAQD